MTSGEAGRTRPTRPPAATAGRAWPACRSPRRPAARRRVVLVVEGPRPLLADHVDGVVRAGRHLGDFVAVLDGEEEEHPDDHERHQRVEDLHRQVVAHLPGGVVVALAVPHHDPHDQAPDQHADDQGGDPGTDPEALDGPGPVRCTHGETEPFPLLLGRLRTTGQQQGAEHHSRTDQQASLRRTCGAGRYCRALLHSGRAVRTHGAPFPSQVRLTTKHYWTPLAILRTGRA